MATTKAKHAYAQVKWKGTTIGEIADPNDVQVDFEVATNEVVSTRSGSIPEMIIAGGRVLNVRIMHMECTATMLDFAFPDMTQDGDAQTYDSDDIHRNLSTSTLCGELQILPYDETGEAYDLVAYGCLIPVNHSWNILPGEKIVLPLAFKSVYRDSSDGNIISIGVATDATAPTVSSSDPSDGASGVAVDSAVEVTFSERMDESTISTDNIFLIEADGTDVPGTVTYSTSTNKATFTPTSNMGASTAHLLVMSKALKDDSGNNIESNTIINFTTA